MRKMAAVGGMVAIAGGSLLLLTELPNGLASGADASATLAELAARSPGARIGGIALKAKRKRARPVALVRGVASVPPGRATPAASLMSAAPVVPVAPTPAGLAALPSDFVAPAGPVATIAAAPPASGGGIGFFPTPGGGGAIIGGGGGGTPGGGSAVVPTPTPTSTPTVPPVLVTPSPTPTAPAVSAVPEPSMWLMFIAGFGFVGSALRRRRRVRGIA